jgi:glutamate--cysteine ligase
LPALPGEKPHADRLGRSPDHRVPRGAPEEISWRCAAPTAGPWNRICALPAFWVGLLYDQTALDAAWDLVKGARDLALEALKISAYGLKRRARLNTRGIDESLFLEPLIEFAQANQTPAERKLELFHGEWNGSVDPVFREFAY